MMLEVERVAVRTNVVYLPPEPHDLQAVSLDFARVSAIAGSSVNISGMLKVEVRSGTYYLCLFFRTFCTGDDQPPCSTSHQLSHLTAILRVHFMMLAFVFHMSLPVDFSCALYFSSVRTRHL